MSRPSFALREIAGLLEEASDKKLEFRPGSEARIAAILERLPAHDPIAGMGEVRALLGLVVLLRDERRSPGAAAALDRALSHSPEAVRYLIEMETSRLANVERTARTIATERPHAAPRVDARAPAGSVKVSSFGGARDLDRRRVERR